VRARPASRKNVIEAASYAAEVYRSLCNKGIRQNVAECVGREAGLRKLAMLDARERSEHLSPLAPAELGPRDHLPTDPQTGRGEA